MNLDDILPTTKKQRARMKVKEYGESKSTTQRG